MIRNPPANAGGLRTWVGSLHQEDPLEQEMATHSSILAGKSHGQRSLVGYSPWGHRESYMTEHPSIHGNYMRSSISMCYMHTYCLGHTVRAE